MHDANFGCSLHIDAPSRSGAGSHCTVGISGNVCKHHGFTFLIWPQHHIPRIYLDMELLVGLKVVQLRHYTWPQHHG